MLRTLGIPRENLRLVFGNIKSRNEYHMVLAYVGNIKVPREERIKSTWILDNVNKKVMKAEERKDLLYIYALDSDDTMVVMKGEGKNGKIAAVKENTNLRQLKDIKEKIAKNMAEFQKMNEGRSLFPE